MPNRDRTGPAGKGRPGRGLGPCSSGRGGRGGREVPSNYTDNTQGGGTRKHRGNR